MAATAFAITLERSSSGQVGEFASLVQGRRWCSHQLRPQRVRLSNHEFGRNASRPIPDQRSPMSEELAMGLPLSTAAWVDGDMEWWAELSPSGRLIIG